MRGGLLISPRGVGRLEFRVAGIHVENEYIIEVLDFWSSLRQSGLRKGEAKGRRKKERKFVVCRDH